jgi:hypothetical protein
MTDSWRNVSSIIASLRKTSALFSLLVLDVLLAALTSLSFLGAPDLIKLLLSCIFATAVIATIIAYFIILLFKDPSLLRSEVHVRQMRALDILGDNLHGPVSPADIVAIANPSMPMRDGDIVQLPPGTERQDSDNQRPTLS